MECSVLWEWVWTWEAKATRDRCRGRGGCFTEEVGSGGQEGVGEWGVFGSRSVLGVWLALGSG